MSSINNELELLRGKDYEVTDSISIRQPTIGEICDYGEKEYFSLVSLFTATPFDMIAQLDTIGIDFTQITAFQMFCLFASQFQAKDTTILFKDTDFSRYVICEDENGLFLKNENSIISEPVYTLMTTYIRKLHNIPPPKYQTVGNETTKKMLIQYAYDDLKYAKRKKYKSQLLNLVSYIVNANGCYGYDNVWDAHIYAFFDAIRRTQVIESVNRLYTGIYTGNIDSSKLNKKELNCLRDLD